MKRITTPVLCLLLGVILAFTALLDASGARADSWADSWDDDDDRPGYRQSAWHPREAHRGKERFHKHKHGHKHAHGHKHGHRHGRGPHRGHWSDDAAYIHDNFEYDEVDSRPLDIRPETAAVWRNPPEPIGPDQSLSIPSEELGAGPCREYTATARIAGREQQIYGRACRQPDGAWKFEPE